MNEPNDHDSNEPSGAILWLLAILLTMAALGFGAAHDYRPAMAGCAGVVHNWLRLLLARRRGDGDVGSGAL